MGSVAMVGAEPSLLANVGRQQSFLQCLPLAAITTMRPTLRYPDFDIALVGPAFEIQGFGGSVHFDSSNTPGFNNFTTLITDGQKDARLVVDLEFFIQGALVFSQRDNAFGDPEPDLQGLRIAFVRLTVSGLDAGVSTTLCTPVVFNQFVSATVDLEIWGEPQLSFNLNGPGCDPCAAGDVASFFAKVANGGPPVSAELKLSVTPQGGPPIDLLGRTVKLVVPSGEANIPLGSLTVPADAANGAYIVEAALIDPARGTTLARDRLIAVKE
jgi:hypothetical protein